MQQAAKGEKVDTANRHVKRRRNFAAKGKVEN